MASEDHHHDVSSNVDPLETIISQLDRRVEELDREIKELEEELEYLRKRRNEIQKQYIDSNRKEEVEMLDKRMNELIAKSVKIMERIDLELDLGFDLEGPSEEEECKNDDLKMGTKFNQSAESSGTQKKRKASAVFDMESDSSETEKESQEMKKQGDVQKRFLDNKVNSDLSDDPQLPVAIDNEDSSTNIEGLKQDLRAIHNLEKDK